MYHCLQSRTPLPQIALRLCSDTCQTTSHDGSQNITVKVEEGLEAEVDESQVSCVCVFIITHFTTTVCTHVGCLFNVPVCKTILLFIEWLLIIFLRVVGWLLFCGTFHV